MSHLRTLPLIGLAVLAVGSVVLFARGQWSDGFPHAEHSGLFPLCIGCHEGVQTGNPTDLYPDPATCTSCHDGERERRVDWTGPSRRVTNLRFDHQVHEAEVQEHEQRQLDCSACHNQPGTRRMDVEFAVVGQCLDCHAHQAREHYVDADCATCHVPLADTRFTAARVADLPSPPSHARPDFLERYHGLLAGSEPARCSTCHTRELCSSCHVNAAQVAEIGTIPPAGRELGLPTFTARYPLPASHLQPGWEENHARVATVAECSTCHARESCMTCHSERPPRLVREHPSVAAVTAPGVRTGIRAPESHLSAFFLTQHGAIAAARPQNCATCHTQTRFCQTCHEPIADAGGAAPRDDLPPGIQLAGLAGAPLPAFPGRGSTDDAAADTLVAPASSRAAAQRDTLTQRRPRGLRRARAPEFHPSNYIARHSAEAYAQRLECSSCHNSRVFCRDCHQQLGFSAAGRLGPGFHDAEPLWLFRHGQGARQTLESCTACHSQQDCMACHSQLGSFQVSPHGRNFDAERAQRRNPQICGACHIGDPLNRR